MHRNFTRRIVSFVVVVSALGLIAVESAAELPATLCPSVEGNQCVVSVKASTNGGPCQIIYKMKGALCDDHNACTWGETCNGTGSCTPNRPAPESGTIACAASAADTAACKSRVCNNTSSCAVNQASTGTTCTASSATTAGYCSSAGACVVPAPTSVTFDNNNPVGGQVVNATVTLAAPAPPGGLTVALSSNNQQGTTLAPGGQGYTGSMALFPLIASVNVAAGGTTGTFPISLVPQSNPGDVDWCVWPTATPAAKGCMHAHYRTFPYQPPPPVFTFATSHGHAHRGESFTATVTITQAAPSMGWYVPISFTNQPYDTNSQWYWNTCGGGPTINGPQGINIAAGATQGSATFSVPASSLCGEANFTVNSGGSGPAQMPSLWMLVVDPAKIKDTP